MVEQATVHPTNRRRLPATRNHPHDSHNASHCYELFYRAVVQMDEQAWASLYDQYHRLIRHWLRPAPGNLDVLVNQVFVRFWRALSPVRFADFYCLEKIMAYLKCCARSVAVDAQRQQARQQRVKDALARTGPTPIVESAEGVLDKVVNGRLYEYAREHLNDPQERLAFRASFEWGMGPKFIAERWPDDFGSAREVTRIKERILKRLRRDERVRVILGMSLV